MGFLPTYCLYELAITTADVYVYSATALVDVEAGIEPGAEIAETSAANRVGKDGIAVVDQLAFPLGPLLLAGPDGGMYDIVHQYRRLMESLAGILCVWSKPGLGLAGRATKPCHYSCPPLHTGAGFGRHVSSEPSLGEFRHHYTALHLLHHPVRPHLLVLAEQARPQDVAQGPVAPAGGRPPGLGPGMGWARPPRAPTWPGIFSSICHSLVQSCSARPALVPASVGPAHISISVPGFSFTSAATGGQRSAAGRSYRPVRLNSASSHSAACYPSEADADVTGVERETAGHTRQGMGCSNLYEMCADHPAPSSPPISVLLSPPHPSSFFFVSGT